jgi:hypothetical protein
MTGVKAVEKWAEAPLGKFVKESGARLSLLTTSSGQVIAQYGFAKSLDVMAAAALGAGVVSSTSLMAQMVGENGPVRINNRGNGQGIFLGEFDTPRGKNVILAVYDSGSSAGLVQLFFEDLVEDIKSSCPPPDTRKVVLAEDFERELNDNLAALFGRK